MSGQEEMRAKTEELLDAMKGEMAKRKTKKLMIRSEQQNGADGQAGGGAGRGGLVFGNPLICHSISQQRSGCQSQTGLLTE